MPGYSLIGSPNAACGLGHLPLSGHVRRGPTLFGHFKLVDLAASHALLDERVQSKGFSSMSFPRRRRPRRHVHRSSMLPSTRQGGLAAVLHCRLYVETSMVRDPIAGLREICKSSQAPICMVDICAAPILLAASHESN